MLEILTESTAALVTAAFLFSLLIGSFLNVVIYRLPVMMERDWRREAREILETPGDHLPEGRFDLIAPRSRCPQCGHRITALQNVPVISYLLLRGRCAACSEPVSKRYPIIELATAAVSATVAWRFGFTIETAMALGITWTLVAISMIDADHQIIPDSLVLPLLWAGLVASLFSPAGGSGALFVSPREAIIGAAAGYLSLWSVYHLFRLLTGKEGMGYGDFKLLAALGAWLGWTALPMIIVMSAFVGAVVGIALIALRGHDRNVPIPFGPFLAAAGWIVMLFGDTLSAAYLNLF
ncbi:MAG: A24 family peptidase [Woeseiaceae bacterium]|nr:A24 family peptidase [Woeseiaceae bacterium]